MNRPTRRGNRKDVAVPAPPALQKRGPMIIQLHFTGRGYPAAAALPSEIHLEQGADLAAALAFMTAQLDGETLPSSCLVAVSGSHVGTLGKYLNRPLRDGDEIVVLAPVAGG